MHDYVLTVKTVYCDICHRALAEFDILKYNNMVFVFCQKCRPKLRKQNEGDWGPKADDVIYGPYIPDTRFDMKGFLQLVTNPDAGYLIANDFYQDHTSIPLLEKDCEIIQKTIKRGGEVILWHRTINWPSITEHNTEGVASQELQHTLT